jgi:hypothetical protein
MAFISTIKPFVVIHNPEKTGMNFESRVAIAWTPGKY